VLAGAPAWLLVPVGPECVGTADLQLEALRPHLWCSHQPTLATGPGAHTVRSPCWRTKFCAALHTTLPRAAHSCCRCARSAKSSLRWHLVVPPVKLSTVGSRAFPVAASQTWNSLPEDVTSALCDHSSSGWRLICLDHVSLYYSTFSGRRSDMSLRPL